MTPQIVRSKRPSQPALPTALTGLRDESLENNSPLSVEERQRVLSAVRLQLTLTVFVVALLLAVSAVFYLGVTRIFDWLTPSIRRDLQHKAQRGALELAQTAQLGMVLRDSHALKNPLADYLHDPDVVGLVVQDAEGNELFRYGSAAKGLTALLARPSGSAQDLGDAYGAWSASEIEAVKVGRVGLVLSKARLEAGMQLRKDILRNAGASCLVALLLCLLFVHFYIGPILRVTGEAFLRLERTTEAALAAARLKSHFLANMSHEIRTPMNGIIGMLDLLSRTVLTAKQQRYTQTIESSTRGLLTIIDDILDFSKLEAGKYVLRVDDFELRQMTQEVAELLSPKAHAKGIELIQRVDKDVPYSIHGDVDRLKQILSNLISNAIKFTDRGHVYLRVSKGEPTEDGFIVRFAIKDTGVGISRADQALLFGVFSQVDGSLTRKHGGTGLGLAISKRLVEAMGGKIGVDSDPGQGSTFWFTIATREGALVAPDQNMPPRTARVLLVSENEAQRETMCELVERWGMRCTVAATVEQACDLIKDSDPRPFDAAVVDGTFDEAGAGSKYLFELCAAESLPLVRMLSTTQMASGSHDGDSRQVFLTKPVRVSELYNGLVALLDGVPLVKKRKEQVIQDRLAGETGTRGMVLVVDDNEVNRVVAVELLNELGYTSEMACNGLEALEKAQRGGFVAILMDCQMPEMDGYEATRRIRALPPPLCRTPIIALTAHAMAGDRDRVLKAGMDDYTAKPVRARALARVLQRWVARSDDSGELKSSTSTMKAVDAAPSPGKPVDASPARGTAPVAPASEAEPEVVVLDPTLPRSARVIELFIKGVPEMMNSLDEAIAQNDVPRVKAVAHKLKGSCLSLGAERMAAACYKVERAAADGRIDAEARASIPGLFEQLTPLLVPNKTSTVVPSQERKRSEREPV